MQRAIEGELTTSIQSLESVRPRGCTLRCRNRTLFREQQNPGQRRADPAPGRTLERGQIAGIVRVVSGSVPELNAKAVSVVDSTAAALSGRRRRRRACQPGLDSQQLAYRREVEAAT